MHPPNKGLQLHSTDNVKISTRKAFTLVRQQRHEFWVTVQFRGLELFRKKGTLFEEESYLAKIFRPFSLYLHTFTVFTMHFDVEFLSVTFASRPPTIGKIAMFWPSCRDHDVTMQVRDSSQPITRRKAWQPRAGDAVDKLTASCHVDTMAAISWNYVGKNIEITSEWGPSIHNRINNLSMKV